MKSRFATSVPTLFAGKQIRNFSKSISATSKFTIFNCKFENISSFLNQGGIESSRRSVHISSVEDDFSELGPPMAGGAISQLKLLTEKPEPFLKTDLAGKASVTKSSHLEYRSSLVDIVLNLDKSSQAPNSKPHINHDVSKSDVTQKNSAKIENSSYVSTKNVPDAVGCSDVDSKVVTIRIQGIGKGTTDPMIHSICKSIGALEGLAKPEKDVVDALFIIKNDADLQSIVKRLNSTIIDDCRWSAYELPRNSTSSAVCVNEDVKSKLGLEINNHLIDFKRKLDSKRIDFEDLQRLHLEIMHLEVCQPTISYPSHQD